MEAKDTVMGDIEMEAAVDRVSFLRWQEIESLSGRHKDRASVKLLRN